MFKTYRGEPAWREIKNRLQPPNYFSRNDHSYKLRERRQRTDTRKFSFLNRTIRDWNALPADLLKALPITKNIWNYVLNQNMKQESSTSKLNEVLTSNVAAKATPLNIAKAKEFVQRLTAHGESNIHDALLKALATSRLHMGRSADNEVFESILVFLTAGKPSMGITDTHTIVPSVSKANAGQTSVFSLELGNDDTVDYAFLEKLSSTNLGFAQKVQSSSGTAEQFRAFYRQFESPVLADISFKYQPKQFVPASLTTHTFRRTFSGSELAVAGQLLGEDIDGEVQGRTSQGSLSYPFIPMYFTTTDGMTRKTTKTTSNTFQRIWEYLRVRQLLQDCSKQDKRRTLSLAKEYSFVTPMTSLVMKSRGSNYVKIKNTSPSMGRSMVSMKRKNFFDENNIYGDFYWKKIYLDLKDMATMIEDVGDCAASEIEPRYRKV
ncbi:hypothetical protein ANN_17811 [Periplaneta americana]|uniref:Uncharacterized protein n=1 Tax=Periplaneta americana TaxID=6978 RepID=A0ABQ8STZ8_PERAM|nr:hypothetical protein ANN_17811 [Periplaneta americana]